MRRLSPRREPVLCALVAVAAACVLWPAAAAAERPNVVVIVTDDQRLDEFDRETMPRTYRLLADRGTTFTNAIVTTPICCPSRASLLTGQYGHNNGVLDNLPGYAALRDRGNVLPVWLRRAGYRTGHVGRFLNYYPQAVGSERRAPGWSLWKTVHRLRYYDYAVQTGRRTFYRGHRTRDHLSRQIGLWAGQFLRSAARNPEPFYLQVDHLAPHTEVGIETPGPCRGYAIPVRRDLSGLEIEPRAPAPSYDEQDVTDKPAYVKGWPRMDAEARDIAARVSSCSRASLKEVDRSVARIYRVLRETGELARTAIIFTSDNGFFNGEHRFPRGKFVPYEETLRVPMVLVLPRALRNGPLAVDAPVANIDLAPTILRLAGATPCSEPGHCRVLDGRSLVRAAQGRPYWGQDRALVVERALTVAERPFGSCRYEGLRVAGWVYIQHHEQVLVKGDPDCVTRPQVELYDLGADPYQLQNLHPPGSPSANPAMEAALAARLDALRDCAGAGPRDRPQPGTQLCE